MRVEVYLSSSRPHYLAKKGPEQGVLVRVGSSNRQADPQLIEELKRQVMGLSFDALPMPELSLDDLDYPAMQQAFGATELNENKLLTLKLLVKHQGKLVPSRGAVLLFGRQRTLHFDDAWIQCGRFRGLDKVHIFDQTELHDHLPQAVHSIEQFLQKHAYKSAEFGGMQRVDHWSIPVTILREAIVNALVHCDYSQRGSPIRVAFYDDRIEIESPGLIMPGVTIEDMKRGVSVIRNPVIARVFRELKLVEQWGSGIQRMFAESAEQGLPEPIIEEIANRLRIIIPLSQIHSVAQPPEPVTQSVTQPVTQPVTQSDNDYLLLRLLRNGPMASSELREAMNLKHRKHFRTNQLDPALAQGLIEMTIPDKPNSPQQKYRLTPAGAELIKDMP